MSSLLVLRIIWTEFSANFDNCNELFADFENFVELILHILRILWNQFTLIDSRNYAELIKNHVE